MIRLYHVYKRYSNDIIALYDITFQIKKGAFFFITGPSGAGKTTLLRLLFCEERPTEGEILIDGRNISRLPKAFIPHIRRDIGVVFQDFKLIPDWTVYDNVAFVLEVIGTPRSDIRKRTIKALGKVGLQHKIGKKPPALSGGEQQRVAIARALVKEPKILLADEPTGNLDPDTAFEVMEVFKEVNVMGTTVVVATHDRTLISRYSGEVIAINKGRIEDLRCGITL